MMLLRAKLGSNLRFVFVRFNFLFVTGIITFPVLAASSPTRADGTRILNDRDIPYDRGKSEIIHVEILDSSPRPDSTRMQRHK